MASDTKLESILETLKLGSRSDYDRFVGTLADTTTEDKSLVKCLMSIKDCVTLLDKNHEGLIGVLLKLNWCYKSDTLIKVYQSVILNLVSVHTDFLRPCLKMIFKKFTPDMKFKDGELQQNIKDDISSKDNKAFKHVHSLLKAITKIVPMASSASVLMPIMSVSAPYMAKPIYVQECYIRNVIQLTYYLPTLRQAIIEHVIHRIIAYDIQVPRSKLTEAISEDSQESGIFNMEEGVSCLESAEKLDVMMILLFEYVKSICFVNGELQWEATKRFYREMLFVFEKIILPTYACAHTQFIMFYIVSLKTELCDGFIDYLWKQVQNPNVQRVYRQAAVTYIGSLLARGKFVCVRTVMRTLELMMSWAQNYTQSCVDCVSVDVTHHGPFYSVCQAIFYVFIFRQKEIFDTKKGLKWAETLQFQHLIQSRLNPLKVCLPLIVKTFASVTRQHQLVFCDHIIEQNARSVLAVVSDGTHKVLEAYFPFDPYLLERSKHYIEEIYREYDNSADMDMDSSGEEDEDDDDMFGEEVMSSSSVAMATTPGSLVDKSNMDFMNYGTSPGFTNLT